MNMVYVSSEDNRSIAYSADVFSGNSYLAPPPPGDWLGRAMFNRDSAQWELDPPYVRTHEDDVRDAETYRRNLIAQAEKTMAGWILDLNLGLISEEDKQKLIAWRLYVKALNALVLDAAPEIEWPPRPQN